MSAPISCLATRRIAPDALSGHGFKPVLSPPDYLALLNQCLQAHPMYLEGMVFPLENEVPPSVDDGDAGEQGLPLHVMVRDTRWDHFGVFASVIEEVGQQYELAAAASVANQVPALACHQRPGAFKAARMRQTLR